MITLGWFDKYFIIINKQSSASIHHPLDTSITPFMIKMCIRPTSERQTNIWYHVMSEWSSKMLWSALWILNPAICVFKSHWNYFKIFSAYESNLMKNYPYLCTISLRVQCFFYLSIHWLFSFESFQILTLISYNNTL